MGLLDGLNFGAEGGGLLDFLRNNAMNQQFNSGLPSDQAQYSQPPMQAMGQMQPQMFAPNQPTPMDNAQWPYGPNGAPSQANAQAPIPQQPPPIIPAQPIQPQMSQPQAPGFGDKLLAGFQSWANTEPGNIIGGIANGIGGFASGQRSDPAGIAKQNQNLTMQALIQKGVDPQTAQAAIGNPELLKTLITQTYGPQTVQTLGNGYVWDPKQGKAVQAYEPEGKKSFHTFKDAMGNEVPVAFDPSTGKTEPIAPAGMPTAQAALPSSIEELQKSDPAMASQVQAVLDGRVPYPTGSRLNPKQQMLKELVTQIDPTFDATTSKTRAKFNVEFGSTSPSTVGGQKILMGTALGHLGEVADSAAGLHNSDGGGLAFAGHWANSAKNMTTENAAKANALEDKVAKFSGEVGKLYSGSQGGGVHEREDTRHRMGSDLTSAELASGLEASRDLILSKQKALEDQAVTIFGPEKAAKYDFIGPDGRKALDKIESSIAQLRGGKGPASSPSSASAPANESDIAHNPKTGETLIRKGGKWVPFT